MYPIVRLRRNRRLSWLRDLTAETNLCASDLILPLFIMEGERKIEEISSMPGIYRYSIDEIVKVAKNASLKGIRAVALFPSVDTDLKSEDAEEAYSLDNLICRTIRAIKNAQIDIGIICDVALDAYTTHGHDGILVGDEVDNDHTVAALIKQSLVLAKAGADIVAPSDMMDGRVMAIRDELDAEGFDNVNILAYAAKYNSSFYGPFREAVQSKQKNNISKATYQMDIRNVKEAIREIEYDIEEGADMVIIKPGMPFLDVISVASKNFNIPIFAYQVSGEYSMMKIAANSGILNWDEAILESLIAFKRAGATKILSYAALEVADMLKH